MWHRLTATLALIVAVLAIATDPIAAATSTPSSNAPPFANGTIASVTGSTISVQGANGATTVAVTGTTTYQQTKPADASTVAVGDCVRVTGTGSLKKGITAFSMALSAATSDGCTQGRPGGADFGGGAGRNLPSGGSGAPGGTPPQGNRQLPTGAPNGNGNGGAASDTTMASGTITSVSGDSLTVKATTVTPPTKKNAKPKTTTKKVKVTFSSATTITQTVPATVAELAVGSCMTATGTPNDTGILTAASITISQAENGACTTGFGFGAPQQN
jgi:hypothetical protein